MRDVVPWLMDECRVKELWLPNHPMIRQLLEEARPEWEVMNDGKGLVRAFPSCLDVTLD